MGLIDWIKSKYYTHRLNQADEYVQNGNLDKAEMIYTTILEKQEWAVIHLARMISTQSNTVQEQVTCLNRIVDLVKYTNTNTNSDYQRELENHIGKMENNADKEFKKKKFSSAVLLVKSILSQKNNVSLQDKLHRFQGFDYYLQSTSTKDYKSLLDLSNSEFKKMSSVPNNDIKSIQDELISRSQFVRTIYALTPFLNSVDWVKKCIVDFVAEVALGKDSEFIPTSISSFCPNVDIANEAADKLAKLAKQKSNKKDYKTAVVLDKLAAEYKSDDNAFNYQRCVHVVEELSERAIAKEVEEAINLAKKLHLSESQINQLLSMICDFTDKAESEKAINICKLFKGEKAFDKVYIDKAQELCSNDKSSLIDTEELLLIIKNNSTAVNYPDVLGAFVNSLPFESEFFDSAIKQIIEQKSTKLLKHYWSIRPNSVFIKRLIDDKIDSYQEFVSFIATNYTQFLENDTIKSVFCSALSSLKEPSYILSTAENLVKNGCNIEKFYINTALEQAGVLEPNEAFDIVDHVVDVIISMGSCPKVNISSKLDIKSSWPLLTFAKMKGKMQVGDFINKDTNITFKSCIFTNSNEERCYVGFDDELGELTPDEISSRKNELKVVERVSGNLYLCAQDEFDDYIKLCDNWITLFIRIHKNEYLRMSNLSQKIKFLDDSFRTIADKLSDTTQLQNQSFFNLWTELETLYLEKSKSQPKDKAIESLLSLRGKIKDACNESFALVHYQNLTGHIVKFEWSLAQEFEIDQLYKKAAEVYDSAAKENVASFQKRAEFRYLICCLKDGSITKEIEDKIQDALQEKSFQAIREDIAYRFACYLIKSIRPSEAEYIINTYLPDESELLNLCKNIHIKEAEKYLEEFNAKLALLHDFRMSSNEAIEFYKEIDSYKTKISTYLSDTSAKFSKYKVQLKAYIINSFFDEENYERAFKALHKMYPNFVDNDLAYRNLAVSSMGIIESDCSDEQQLRIAISLALSAIYTDKLFIASLENTSWDDQYRFTLDDSLGRSCEDDYDSLPENVNFDTAIEAQNVSIKDVQNNLIIRIEKAISEYHPRLEEFFRQEKDAVEKLLELNLDENFIIATPGLVSTLDVVKTSIREALDYDYNQGYGNQEEVLVVGVLYGIDDNEYSEYKVAQQLLNVCKGAVSGSVSAIKGSFNLSAIEKIKSYDSLFNDLKASCSNAMNNAIREEKEYAQFLDCFEPICKVMKDISLSLTCSNYINGQIIKRLNNESMKDKDGIKFMVRIYNLAPSNEQVKRNVEGILRKLIHDAEKHNSSQERNIIKKSLSDLNGKFDKAMALTTIIAKVNNNRIEKYEALKQLYNLYLSDKSDSEVCDALATMVKICIHEYIISSDSYSERTEVRTVLNNLKTHISSTFKDKANLLAMEYLKIMKDIPEDNRMLLMTGIDLMGNTLNSKGRALKEGLDFMKDLGNLDELIRKHR